MKTPQKTSVSLDPYYLIPTYSLLVLSFINTYILKLTPCTNSPLSPLSAVTFARQPIHQKDTDILQAANLVSETCFFNHVAQIMLPFVTHKETQMSQPVMPVLSGNRPPSISEAGERRLVGLAGGHSYHHFTCRQQHLDNIILFNYHSLKISTLYIFLLSRLIPFSPAYFLSHSLTAKRKSEIGSSLVRLDLGFVRSSTEVRGDQSSTTVSTRTVSYHGIALLLHRSCLFLTDSHRYLVLFHTPLHCRATLTRN